jgi:DNA primase
MAASQLLNRLNFVRKNGAGRWMARCPAHEDRGPSLSVRELDDGRVLVHCFAGCDASSVLSAVGLSLSDLFPERPAHDSHYKSTKPNHYHASREALRVLHVEALIVAIAAENVAQGVVLDSTDRARVVEAANKIRTAAEVTR